MGLFGKRKKDRIRGTARVVGLNWPPHDATHTRLVADVVVEAPGIPAFAMEYKKMVVSISKWPAVGELLPALIDPDDPHDIEVLWDEVVTGDERSRQRAEQLAAALRGEVTPTGADADTINVDAATIFANPVVTPGSGVVGITVVASQSDADPVERLDKLAKLHAAGVVDDAQFAQLRDQILGQSGLD
jgi:hypothetical protein